MAVMIDTVLDSTKWASVGLELVRIEIFEIGPDSDDRIVREVVGVVFAIRSVGGGYHPGRYASEAEAVAVLDAFLEAHLAVDPGKPIPVMDANGNTILQTKAAFLGASSLTPELWAMQAQPRYEVRRGLDLTRFLAIPIGERGPKSRSRWGLN
jgi:hypothetical protein